MPPACATSRSAKANGFVVAATFLIPPPPTARSSLSARAWYALSGRELSVVPLEPAETG